jgi:hypothetical protein
LNETSAALFGILILTKCFSAALFAQDRATNAFYVLNFGAIAADKAT